MPLNYIEPSEPLHTGVELEKSLYTGFVDQSERSKDILQPELVTNNWRKSRCVLDTILQELSTCDKFFMSAAFLTKSGVAVLLNALLESKARGVNGKILVSEYLGFTQPEALRALRQFTNVEVRVATTGNMHGKTYLFDKTDHSSIMIGSSNLTASALKENNELNLKFSTAREDAIYKDFADHLESDFENSILANEEYISEYETRYKDRASLARTNPENSHTKADTRIVPNSMQKAALDNLHSLRTRGQRKGLIISATGTGKTYLSAFDVKAFHPRRLLFVVHRKNIALAALKTFKSLFGKERTYGIFSGEERNLQADFIFSTVQTISRDQHLDTIDPCTFDYIIIDETHRAGADSYQKIIRHFEPDFLLGMTATPERTDGHDIFADFDHNIAYEIRLHRAMEEDILSPFHYFGVTDLRVDGEEISDLSDFNALVSQDRINHILEQSRIYGCDTGDVRGLIFCSRKVECIALSDQLNSRGLRTIALTGDANESTREEAIRRLESDEDSWKLDYIITVDIFNEGIDIPRVNQILMLRPTSSAIIFVQQLGRGLRKVEGKDYLTVIDFIGNYQNNYLVPIALYGDTSYSKDKLRRLISSGSSTIPGSSTINFDQISKKRIFDSIDQANLSLLKDLKSDYTLLKYEIGRPPMMMDFVNHGRRDPYSFVQYSGSYLQFVQRADPALSLNLSGLEISLLSAFSKEINNGKRVEDSIALKQILDSGITTHSSITLEMYERFRYRPKIEVLESVFHNLSLKFVTDKVQNRKVPLDEKLGYEVMKIAANTCEPADNLTSFLLNPMFQQYLSDSTDYSIQRWQISFSKSRAIGGFLLYEKYSRKDVFRILNWSQNPVAQNVGGYLISPDKKDCAIFVNYDKRDHTLSTQYIDEFVNESQFQWMSKNRRRMTSPEIVQFKETGNPTRLPLFIKKSNDEGLDFYYMGELAPILESFHETTIGNDKGEQLPAVSIRFDITPHVESDIYRYLTAE